MNPADPFGLIGQVLDGQFRVDKFVGEGGFSIVYRGHHAGLNEPIAIKCLKLPPTLGSALVESFIRRFRDESRIHYRLSQGNLAIARSIASGSGFASNKCGSRLPAVPPEGFGAAPPALAAAPASERSASCTLSPFRSNRR